VRVALILGFVAAASGAGYWFYRGYEPPYDYGALADDVAKLEGVLAKEPCDRPTIFALLQKMLSARNSGGVLRRAAAFSAKCGEEPKLLDFTYLAHQRLGELDKAVAELSRRIEQSPANPYYLAWRGGLYEEQGNLDLAVEDLQKAMTLYPAAIDIPQNLASVYEKQGKFCDAIVPLEEVAFRYDGHAFATGVRSRVTALEQKGVCTAGRGGRVTIRALAGSRMFRAKVRLLDKENARFVVDTGATYVTLTRRLADRLHLDLDRAPTRDLQTANGKREGTFVILPSVAIEGLSAERVPGVVVDDLGPDVDGLLGQSFLSRFEMKQAEGVLELSTRAETPSDR
jgi:aspartyl protease family protein